MKKLDLFSIAFITISVICITTLNLCAQVIPNLGAASEFGILSGGNIVSNDSIYCNGKIGAYGTISSNCYASDSILSQHLGSVAQALSQIDTAIQFCQNQYGNSISGNLTGQTLTSGVYSITGTLTLSDTITLNGDSNSVFIFNISDSLIVKNKARVEITNCKPNNIFWIVGGKSRIQSDITFYGILLTQNTVELDLNIHGWTCILTNGNLVNNHTSYFPADFTMISYSNMTLYFNFLLQPCVANTNTCQLVPNGNFENYVQIPWAWDQVNTHLCFWNKPTDDGTADYFHYNPGFPTNVDVPNNFAGSQGAHSGDAYAGIYVYSLPPMPNPPDPYREYLQTALKSQLIAGNEYYVEFWCSLADQSDYEIDRLGLAFNNTAINISAPYHYTLPTIPAPDIFSTVTLSNTQSWTRIGACYIANGTETQLIIGNFYDDNDLLLTISPAAAPVSPVLSGAYYYIDDVSVTKIDIKVEADKSIPCNSQTQIFASSCLSTIAGTTYQWSPASDFVNSQVLIPLTIPLINNTCYPIQKTYTLTVTSPSGCSVTDDITITVLPCSTTITGVVTGSCLTDPCGTISTSVSGVGSFAYLWSNGAATSGLTGVLPGTYTVIVTNGYNCTASKVFVVPNTGPCLTIEKTVDKTFTYAYPNQIVTYTVTVTNNSCLAATYSLSEPNDPNFVESPNVANIYPGVTGPYTISAGPGTIQLYSFSGYYNNIGQYQNCVDLITPNGTVTDCAPVVTVLSYCPGAIVAHATDCHVGSPVELGISLHNLRSNVTDVAFTMVYPDFLSPLSAANGSFPPTLPTAQFQSISSATTYTGGGVTGYKQQDVVIHFNTPNGVSLGPPTYGIVNFNLTIVSAPTTNIYYPFLLGNITTTTQTPGPSDPPFYTQAGRLFLPDPNPNDLCFPNIVLPDASFTIYQKPCTGEVTVTGNYNSPTAIHRWVLGDNRIPPILGQNPVNYDYYSPITMGSQGPIIPPIPPASPGVYTIEHTVIENGIANTQSMGVVLYPACCQQNITIRDGDVSSMYGGFISSTTVDIEGKFTIDQPFVFTQCTITMEPGSEIIVQTPNTFRIDQSTVEACSNMWKGIKVENGATLVSTVSSINDAQYAIDPVDGATIGLYASTFDRNFVTIHIPDNPNWPYYNIVGHIITDCTFDCTSNLHAPFTGQTPAPGSKSFAAVNARQVDLDFTPMSGNFNHFQNLSNGIVGINCNLTVADCDFTNIQKDNAYISFNFNGSGIYLNGTNGYYYLHQTGYGLNSTPSFNRCFRGIYTEGMNINSSANRMVNMDYGYRADYGKYKSIDIVSNFIRSNQTGIDLRMNDNARHLLVEGNQIHFGLPGISFARGIAAINVVDQNGSNDDSRINSNYIWHVPGASNAAYGISMTSASYYFITNNELHLVDNLLNKIGISTYGCQHDEVSCNIVTGPGSNFDVAAKDQSAYKFNMGDNHTISCNTSNGTTNGFYFSGYPYSTDLKGNNIDFHKYGLQLDNNTIIGSQKWKGNKWYYAPATGGLGAYYLNSTNAIFYKFIYDNTSSPGTVTAPPSWAPSYWFQFLGGSNFECQPNAGSSYCSQFNHVPCDGCNHDFDLAIAQDRIQNGDFTDPSLYELAKELWKLLDENQAYRDSFPVLDSFYVANQNGLLDKINEVREQVANLNSIAPSVSLILQNNQSQIEYSVAAVATQVNLMLNGNLDSAQMAAANLTVNALHSTILSLFNYNQTAINLADSTLILSADNVSVINDAINASGIFEVNDQQVNEIYLATIARGIYTFTSVQMSILYNIAIQCPLAGGNAVWKARAMYSFIDDVMNYDDAIACLNAGIALRQIKSDSPLSDLLNSTSVYPNPATDKATLRYNLLDNTNGQFVISDAFGKEVCRYNLVAKSKQFDFSIAGMAQSVYYYKVFSNNGLIGIGKISIVK